jgi:hypothetical protein
MPFSLLRLRANLIKIRGFRISQAYPLFPILLLEDQILQGIGVTGITPPRALSVSMESQKLFYPGSSSAGGHLHLE